jgi:hypothetical protein
MKPSPIPVLLFFLLCHYSYSQCTKDIDCKGNRICVQGKCQDPQIQRPPCTKDIDCQGDSTCEKGKCVASGMTSQTQTPSNKPSNQIPQVPPSVQPPTTTPNFQTDQPTAQSAPQNYLDCNTSKELGKGGGVLHNSTGWLVGGFGSGILLGLIGMGVIAGVAAIPSPKPEVIPPNVDKPCYIKGYSSKARKENIKSAVSGSASGFLVMLSILSVVLLN